MEVFVNGALVGATDVSSSTASDYGPFSVTPSRYSSEVAVAFVNNNSNGGCDHNLHVARVSLTTPTGIVSLQATDAAHAVMDWGTDAVTNDRAPYFDGVDVSPATTTFARNGALRFFVSPSSSRQGAPLVTGASPGYMILGAGPSIVVASTTLAGPAVVFAEWSGLVHNPGTGGATYSRIFLDGVGVSTSMGIRNGSAPLAWAPQAGNWSGVVGPGQHLIEVREDSDNSSSTLNGGDLSILYWPY
jgi:hypothetical protein